MPPASDRLNVARRIGTISAIGGALAVATALLLLWSIRLHTLPRSMYVSEFGAEGEVTAELFEAALLLIVAGGAVTAIVVRDIRSTAPVLRAWRPMLSLLVACGFFLIASQVTCTAGCPLPVGTTFTWQDFVHTLCAVLAFAAACWGMLQLSFAQGHRGLARFSLVSALAVGLIAAAGGILSLARFGTDVGSWLELVATTIALCWLLVTALAVSALSGRGVAEPVRGPLVVARAWRR
ncbi:MAG: DUF998 domain-containing protein [Cryobacterium sp.]|nr:DUF998 domain-containing protein [Cryobacterium sp.]